jgi:dihydroorotate dehydrogenase
VASISSALVGALGNTPLIIKVGTFQDIELMKSVFKEAAKAKVSAICGINSVSMRVLNQGTQHQLFP